MDELLLKQVFDKYYNKEETKFRLPMSENLELFWKEELKLRKGNALYLPLHSFDGHQYFYNRTLKFVAAADQMLKMMREDIDISNLEEYTISTMADEAIFSSSIEGAHSTKARLNEFIQHKNKPKNKDEKMVYNNYRALEFVKTNIDEPLNENFILNIGEILTEGTLCDGETSGIRDESVKVINHTGEIIYEAPDSKFVKPMLGELISYINDSNIHPIEKAAIAHIFFVTVHPFFDGNGRTARALSFAILLKAGYELINLTPISGILAAERGKYYKSIMSCQNTENGYDFTYFAEYYTSLLAKTMMSQSEKIKLLAKYNKLIKDGTLDTDSRIAKGAYWLADETIHTITTEKWKKKFNVAFETARQDLFSLVKLGFLQERKEGRKMFFDISLDK